MNDDTQKAVDRTVAVHIDWATRYDKMLIMSGADIRGQCGYLALGNQDTPLHSLAISSASAHYKTANSFP